MLTLCLRADYFTLQFFLSPAVGAKTIYAGGGIFRDEVRIFSGEKTRGEFRIINFTY